MMGISSGLFTSRGSAPRGQVRPTPWRSRCPPPSAVRPLASANAPSGTPSISSWKLNVRYGSRRSAVAIVQSPSNRLVVGMRRPEPDPHDDELGRLDRRDADEADQAPAVDVGLRHRRA